ncbi:thiotransferase enzyme MiaB [Candidatus Photodesmus katoptron Akat1]|uniref:tRNA-2-methylthio-N(6)-dimethylallyladenosine synthase n=1 Tax=Candidatus Photodesmus katoptron Akat1 TaxID=1236703 RepID=S3DG50_9GAMM|nr:thiotransferase enzyme MiaB [Candidatus Photodesmus katoptron Akat1]
MNKKLLVKTWGCQMNEYDSSKIIDLLNVSNNYELTERPDEADVLLLNTCSIREKAQEKLFHQLGRWKKLKNNKQGLIIGVGGCVATQEGENIRKRSPFVDIIFGPQTLHRLPKMIEESMNNKIPIIDISFPKIEKFDSLPAPRTKNATAFVSIIEGCSKYCSYCIVPYTRGEEVSRPIDNIIFEINQLSEQGVREINLLGQNVNAYRGLTHSGKICSFAELLRLVASIRGIERIRFTTSHPIEFTDDIIAVYEDTPKIASFLHLPVQSGSDKILTMMKRSHTVIEYKSIIRKLREVRPNIQISSDFIVGFPGESDKDFEDTMKLIKDINFDMSFSFIFSPRPGTPASTYPCDIPEQVKKNRLYKLQKTINNQAINYSNRMLNTKQRVLVEGLSKKSSDYLCARTENNRVVTFKGSLDLIGQFIDVKITDILSHSLQGKLINQ